MSFQSILNFILSPFGIIILIGTFSTLGRMVKSAQDQQTKKRALTDMRKAQRDSLRTGVGSSSTTQTTAPLQTQPTSQSAKQAAWDQKQQMRRDRIELLRTQRVEQLKKLRQKRSTPTQTPQTPQARTSTPAPQRQAPAPIPAPTPARSKHSHQHQHGPFPKAYSRPNQKPYAQSAPLQAQPTQPTPRRRSSPKLIAQPQRTTEQARRVSRSTTDSPIALGSIQSQRSKKSTNARALFRQNIRQAIIAKEILGPPIGLRDPGSTSM